MSTYIETETEVMDIEINVLLLMGTSSITKRTTLLSPEISPTKYEHLRHQVDGLNLDGQVLSQEIKSVDTQFAIFASLIVLTTQLVPNLVVNQAIQFKIHLAIIGPVWDSSTNSVPQTPPWSTSTKRIELLEHPLRCSYNYTFFVEWSCTCLAEKRRSEQSQTVP
jgi:hypothetical protein